MHTPKNGNNLLRGREVRADGKKNEETKTNENLWIWENIIIYYLKSIMERNVIYVYIYTYWNIHTISVTAHAYSCILYANFSSQSFHTKQLILSYI